MITYILIQIVKKYLLKRLTSPKIYVIMLVKSDILRLTIIGVQSIENFNIEGNMDNIQIRKSYGAIMAILLFAAVLVTFVGAFVPAFQVDLVIDVGSVSTAAFMGITFFDVDLSSEDEMDMGFWFSKIDIGIMELFAYVCIFGMIAMTILGIYYVRHRERDDVIYSLYGSMKTCLCISVALYVFCMYIIFKGFDWEIAEALFDNQFIKTETYIPMFLQIGLIICASFLMKHYERALNGEVKPFTFATRTYTMSTNYRTNDNSQYSSQQESERLNLLKQYKDLFDSGIITEEEFNEKKNNF